MTLPKITIHTDADLTPKGKRTARIVSTRSVFGRGRQLRWYVSGRRYREMRPTEENVELTALWLCGQPGNYR